ncbi:MAG TPA: 4-hydroxy-tetrahydrodipicolinate synthase [Bacteroidales bacterium]|nr:4-hydroxy-tetrahydrodipicolinate synthase [Bacteroidales bacterium]HPI68131.1 4-hydroxy-tetrahydrodipicolinate synthase [Bacteroidales bacterium]HPR72399.1 4-hydroxy-tetrahydrodipicolinate synthase [Bacteroidales bacterium]
MKKFKGTGVAIVTPFKNDSSIDFSALGRIINHVIEGGVNYIVGMGTTGEAATLTTDEKQALTSYIVEVIDKRVPLIIGIGGYNTQEVINNIKQIDLEGIDAILSVAPYYNKPNQRGLFQHFKAIATCSPVPVIIYNVPGRTCSNISSDTCLELAHECDNIVGIKEASGDMSQIMRILKRKPENFLVISGDDMLTLPIISAGGSGVISVLANAYPAEWSEMVSNALKNNMKIAREILFRFMEPIDLLFEDGNPSGIKAFLSVKGLCQNNLRLPLVPVNKTVYSKINKAVAELK